MKKIIISTLAIFVLFSCKNEPEQLEWQLSSSTKIEGVNAIGITATEDGLWLSDGDHNRLVNIDNDGNIIKTIDGFDRPMHIDSNQNTIYVPEYGTDSIKTVINGQLKAMTLNDALDAPAGISVYKNEKAIADFYKNRILYFNGNDWISFGKEGKAEGDFYYPTDVQITESAIWVADAYNNRIQKFDKAGKFQQILGVEQKMNAATGIFVSEKEVFITDFENNRILIFDLEGNFKQELSDKIEKPTDVLVYNDKLHVINYRNSMLNIFELKPIEPHNHDH